MNEYETALLTASKAAIEFGASLARFHNAVDALAVVTPHCDTCGWASGWGHRRDCRSVAPAAVVTR